MPRSRTMRARDPSATRTQLVFAFMLSSSCRPPPLRKPSRVENVPPRKAAPEAGSHRGAPSCPPSGPVETVEPPRRRGIDRRQPAAGAAAGAPASRRERGLPGGRIDFRLAFDFRVIACGLAGAKFHESKTKLLWNRHAGPILPTAEPDRGGAGAYARARRRGPALSPTNYGSVT